MEGHSTSWKCSRFLIFTEKRLKLCCLFLFQRRFSSERSVSSHQVQNSLMGAIEAGVFYQKTNIHWFSHWPNVVTVSSQISSSIESETEHWLLLTDVLWTVVGLLHRWLLWQCSHKEEEGQQSKADISRCHIWNLNSLKKCPIEPEAFNSQLSWPISLMAHCSENSGFPCSFLFSDSRLCVCFFLALHMIKFKEILLSQTNFQLDWKNWNRILPQLVYNKVF